MTYVINEACIGEKDLSCVDVCPVDAITPAEGVPADQRDFIAINAAWADGPDEVNRLVAEWQARHPRRRT